MSEYNTVPGRENSEKLYRSLISILLSKHTVYTDAFYWIDQTAAGERFQVEDYLAVCLRHPVNGRENRRQALEEGRAWISIFDYPPKTAPEKSYTIFRPKFIAPTRTPFMGTEMQAAFRDNPESNDVLISNHDTLVRNPFEDPFLAEIYQRIGSLIEPSD